MRKNKFSKSDFNEASLPKNRKELFFDVLKQNHGVLFKIAGLLILFLIPFLAILALKDYSFIVANNENKSNGTMLIICFILEILAILIFAIGISGFAKIFKELCYMEPIFFKDDFLKGVKENIKPTLLIAFLVGIFNFIFQYCYYFIDNGWLKAVPFGVIYFIIYPILFHTLFINFVYTNKFYLNLKLGLYCFIKHIPSTLLMIIITYLFTLINIFTFVNFYGLLFKIVLIAIYMFFLFPYLFLGCFLNEMRIFDIRFNLTNFPNIYRKGLYKIKDE